MKPKKGPPEYAQKFLLSLLREEIAEEVLGDLEEKYEMLAESKSSLRAGINYWYQVFNYIRPFALRKTGRRSMNQFGMLRNYTKITIRNLVKQKLYSSLNIGGLAVGISAFLMIALFIQYEFSYDRFLPNASGIYRIYQREQGNNYMGSDLFAVTPIQLAGVLPDEFPEIKHATKLTQTSNLLSVDDKNLWEDGLVTDEHFMDVFHFNLLMGNPQKILADAQSIVLTQKLAGKLFGDTDPVGKSVRFDGENFRTVTGVFSDLPENSTLQFGYVVNYRAEQHSVEELARPMWRNNSQQTFFTLNEGANVKALDAKFPALITKYHDKESYRHYPFKDTFYSQPLLDLHLTNGINFDIGAKGSSTYVYVFGGIALLVLMLACINYMNLAIARSINRAKEVGLRKVVGAVRKQLIFQFLGESILIAIISLLLAIGLTYLLLPFFSGLVERSIVMDFAQNQYLIPALVALVLVVGLISGSYPALVISSLRPVQIIKGKLDGFSKGFGLQRWLIVGQFTVSIVLVTSSVVIYQQLQFVKNKDLGFNKDHVLVIGVRDQRLFEHYDALREAWLRNPKISSVTASEHLPTNIQSSWIINDADQDKSNDLAIYHSRITADYFKVFGLQLAAGRNFSPDIKSDLENAKIINETAAKALGWTPEEAIGKQFENENTNETVIGVVKDFHLHNLHLPVEPLMLGLYKPSWGSISLKVSADKLPETLMFLEKSLKAYSSYPFDYQFLDDQFNQMYKEDARVGETFQFFTVLSLVIAALGLFGLAAFAAGQRTREIGIRKVLGASVKSIVVLLSTDFLKLVIIAFVLSVPLAWYAMHRWLQDFAYKIELQWWMFSAAGLLALIVANLAIGYQSLRASMSNPVKSLKSE